MQFPTIPSQKVIPPNRRDVNAVDAASAAAVPDRRIVSGSSQGVGTGEPLLEITPDLDRRQGPRRDAPDRRRRQVAVFLDTRTGRDRRGERRRTDDPLPARVDESI